MTHFIAGKGAARFLAMVFSCCAFATSALAARAPQHPIDSCDIREIFLVGLDANRGDTSLNWALQLIKGHCDEDISCQVAHLLWLSSELEHHFALFGAIQVNDRIIELVNEAQDLHLLGAAWMNKYRFYEALGYQKLAQNSLDQAIQYYDLAQDSAAYLIAELYSFDLQPPKQADWKAFFEDRLHRVREVMDPAARGRYHISLLSFLTGADSTHLIRFFLDKYEGEGAVEGVSPYSDPKVSGRLHFFKGDLALAEQDYRNALSWYERALSVFVLAPDPWMVARTKMALAETYGFLGMGQQAAQVLEEGIALANSLDLIDLLELGYGLQYELTRSGGQYAQAVDALEKMYEAKLAWRDRFSDFDMENYLLARERDQLAALNQNQQLALQVEAQQRQRLFILLFAVLVLGGILLSSWWMLRKKKQELELQNLLIEGHSAELKRADKIKNQYFYNISHELRTPMTVILGALEMLGSKKDLSAKDAQLLHVALSSGRRLVEMTEDILEVRRLELKKVGAEMSWVHIGPWLRQLMAQFDSIFSSQGVCATMYSEIPSNLLIRIDKGKFQKIFDNLLGNAVKYCPTGGNVEVKLVQTDTHLHLEVTNEGPGIPEAQLDAIFDRFHQVPDSANRRGGVGIGLSICKEYVELMGGTIEVESVPDAQTTFRVKLPVELTERMDVAEEDAALITHSVAAMQAASSPESRLDSPDSAQRKRLLLVEDSKELQHFLSLILSKHYRVEAVSHGMEAVEWLESGNKCDLVVSDVLMPVMNGYELLAWMRRSDVHRHIPVVILTAKAEKTDRIKALRMGVDSYLTKPFVEEELLATIHNLLERNFLTGMDEGELDERPEMSKEDQKWLEDFEAFVSANLKNDLLAIPLLCDRFAMSEATLFRKVKRLIGLTPKQYIMQVRLERSRQMLLDRVYNTVSQVAAETGFSDVRTFSRNFRRAFGRLPNTYLR